MKVSEAGKAELVFTNEAGEETRELIHNFKGAGVLQGMHNLNDSIESFARAALILRLRQSRISGLQLRIQSLKSMTIHLRTYFRRYSMLSIRISLKKLA